MNDQAAFSRDGRTVEISFELQADEVAVLDGYCQARRLKRGTVLRQILREWSAVKHHESILICRVAGTNPGDSGVTPDADDPLAFGTARAGRT